MYCKYWRSIGLKLGLQSSLLDSVEAQYGPKLSEYLRVVLDKWLVQNVNVTWYHLEMAITNAIRENLGLDPLPISKFLYVMTSAEKLQTLYSTF